MSMWIYERLSKSDLKGKQLAYLFATNTLLVNLGCLLIKKFILHTADAYIFILDTDMNLAVACNYLIMAIACAVFLAVVEVFLVRNVKFTVEDQNHDKA